MGCSKLRFATSLECTSGDKLVKVYRIEHAKSMKGPFQHSNNSLDKLSSHACYVIPTPCEDGIDHFVGERIYAFTKLKHLANAFNASERKALRRYKFMLRCYKVWNASVGHSQKQCCFKRRDARLIWEIPIKEVF